MFGGGGFAGNELILSLLRTQAQHPGLVFSEVCSQKCVLLPERFSSLHPASQTRGLEPRRLLVWLGRGVSDFVLSSKNGSHSIAALLGSVRGALFHI